MKCIGSVEQCDEIRFSKRGKHIILLWQENENVEEEQQAWKAKKETG